MADIRTFNSAKKFAEEILHPLMRQHTEAKIKTRLGAINEEQANKIGPNMRVVRRFNALKERVAIQQTLATEIKATVILNKVKSDLELLETVEDQLKNVEENINRCPDDIMYFKREMGNSKPFLTELFHETGVFLDDTYVQIQYIMTKNKLLFVSDTDEYLEDQEIKEKIKVDNRSS